MLVSMVSIDEFSSAYGLLLLIQGVSNLVGPPFAGYLYDISHIWYYTFGLGGTFIAISGVMLVVLPSINWIKHILVKSTPAEVDEESHTKQYAEEEPFLSSREHDIEVSHLPTQHLTGQINQRERKNNHENGEPRYVETKVIFEEQEMSGKFKTTQDTINNSSNIRSFPQTSPVPV